MQIKNANKINRCRKTLYGCVYVCIRCGGFLVNIKRVVEIGILFNCSKMKIRDRENLKPRQNQIKSKQIQK